MRFVFRKELTAAFCVLHLRSVVFELCGVMSGSLCPVSVLRVCAVLLDSADQLAVLGHIMSVTNGDTTAAAAAVTVRTFTLNTPFTLHNFHYDSHLYSRV